jgi:hypothetical protein
MFLYKHSGASVATVCICDTTANCFQSTARNIFTSPHFINKIRWVNWEIEYCENEGDSVIIDLVSTCVSLGCEVCTCYCYPLDPIPFLLQEKKNNGWNGEPQEGSEFKHDKLLTIYQWDLQCHNNIMILVYSPPLYIPQGIPRSLINFVGVGIMDGKTKNMWSGRVHYN